MDAQEPDPRFVLANERTFLAWVRTSLALIAGGVALAHLVTLRQPGWLQLLLSIVLVVAGALLCLLGYHHWRSCDRALQENRPLPSPRFAVGLVGLVAVFGLLLAIVLALGG
jgi:putative membrane protein